MATGQGVDAAPELVEPSGPYPAGELSAHVARVGLPGQEQAGLEHRFVTGDVEQAFEIHIGKVP